MSRFNAEMEAEGEDDVIFYENDEEEGDDIEELEDYEIEDIE